MPPVRRKSGTSSRRTKSASTPKSLRTKKLRKYSRPSYLYVTLLAICQMAKEAVEPEEGTFTIPEAIQKVFDMSELAMHKLGAKASQSIEDYVLIFRHYGYLQEVDYLKDEEEHVSIIFQPQDSLKQLMEMVERSISDSGEEPSKSSREVFVALSTHLRETVTPDKLREIITTHRNSKSQQQLMYENLVLQRRIRELEDGLALEREILASDTPTGNNIPSTSTEPPTVRPAPRRLGDLVNDSFYMEDVQEEPPHPTTTPARPCLGQISSGSGAYPSPTSLPRPTGGPSSESLGSPSRGHRGMRTPPFTPGGQDDDDDDDVGDGMLINAYLLNPEASFPSAPDNSDQQQDSPSAAANGGRSRVDRRLVALKKLRRRNERIRKAYVAAQKDLIKQRIETKKERDAGEEKKNEIFSLRAALQAFSNATRLLLFDTTTQPSFTGR